MCSCVLLLFYYDGIIHIPKGSCVYIYELFIYSEVRQRYVFLLENIKHVYAVPDLGALMFASVHAISFSRVNHVIYRIYLTI